jgi:hypothetical protein
MSLNLANNPQQYPVQQPAPYPTLQYPPQQYPPQQQYPSQQQFPTQQYPGQQQFPVQQQYPPQQFPTQQGQAGAQQYLAEKPGSYCLRLLNDKDYSGKHKYRSYSGPRHSDYDSYRHGNYGHKYYAELPLENIQATLKQAADQAKTAAQQLSATSKNVKAPLRGDLNDIATQQQQVAKQAQQQAQQAQTILEQLRRERLPSNGLGAGPQVQAKVEQLASGAQQIKAQTDVLADKVTTVVQQASQQAQAAPSVAEAAAKVQTVADTVSRAATDAAGKLQALRATAATGNVGATTSGAAGLIGSLAGLFSTRAANPAQNQVQRPAPVVQKPAAVTQKPAAQVRVINGGVEQTARPLKPAANNAIPVVNQQAAQKAAQKVAEQKSADVQQVIQEQQQDQTDLAALQQAWAENRMPKTVELYHKEKQDMNYKEYCGIRKFLAWAEHAQQQQVPRHNFEKYYSFKMNQWSPKHDTNELYADYISNKNCPESVQELFTINRWKQWKNKRTAFKRRHPERVLRHSRFNADNYHNDKDFAKKFRALDLKEYLKYQRFSDWYDYAQSQGHDVNDADAYQLWKLQNNQNYTLAGKSNKKGAFSDTQQKQDFDAFKRQEHTYDLYSRFQAYQNFRRLTGKLKQLGCCSPCSEISECSIPSACSPCSTVSECCPTISECSPISCPSPCSTISCPSIECCSSSTSTDCASSSDSSSHKPSIGSESDYDHRRRDGKRYEHRRHDGHRYTRRGSY